MKILYAVSPIGLGHATRSSAVALELKTRKAEVIFASGGYAAEYLRGLGFSVVENVSTPFPKVVKGEMKWASLWYAKYWWSYRRTKATMKSLVERLSPDVVVGDEEFSSVELSIDRGFRHFLITDETELGFAKTYLTRAIESRVSKWYGRLLDRASHVVIPDFGENIGNRLYVGPIVRKVTRARVEVRRDRGLPSTGFMVLLSMSGSGVGLHLFELTKRALDEAQIPNAFLVVAGNRRRSLAQNGVYDLGVVGDNQNLIAAADIVVTNAGKSTIDEAAMAGTPVVAIPIRNHSEQERNAATTGYVRGVERNLGATFREKMRGRPAPRIYRGAEIVADLILSD